MLLQQKKDKRHSFSVESLAISSRVEQPERVTDSPYLDYLQTSNSVDINANISVKKWIVEQYSSHGRVVEQQPASDGSTPQATSTPIPNGNKRRRLCSTATPPSSDESQHGSEEWTPMSTSNSNLVIDESSNMSTDTGDKLSPVSSSTSEPDRSGSGESICRRKKSRTAFSGEQLRELERRYKTQKYLTASDRSALARTLQLKDQQVKTWFQNRRMKEKRQQREEEPCHAFSLPTGGVDISQLTALGICPPNYAYQLGSASPLNHSFSASPSTLPSDCPVQSGYQHLSNISAPTDTSTAIHRPVPSIAHAQERVSALTSMRSTSDRNIDMRSDGHFMTSPPGHAGVSDSLRMPYSTNLVPNFCLPYMGSIVHSPYRV